MTVGVQFPALRRPALAAGGFTATRWHSADEKARMGDAILAFIARGMPRSGWTMSLYNRLSNMFGFIAHYDRHGFWHTHFASTAGRVAFLEQIAGYPCWGQPTAVWSDVEREIRARVLESGLIAAYRAQERQETACAEREQLARLLVKHGQAQHGDLHAAAARPGPASQLSLI
ncbi:hypothetical protein HLH26_08285 [Gluconacetobacter sp. 1b LMG 1731]|uniref:Uncharacterized protein n=1 Tax=Gluconacetobacter dulcium TaxID=2729096 RepID=A0A7W4IKR9_9PROT|nr:hypothetical protein [Gluconacetobacter dulcium]MBB2164539.1 hypothetical protein [Gluconacetobacter dulcium]MBB2193694.1 hypothetical protein [Gluconacetobacter dulcium]